MKKLSDLKKGDTFKFKSGQEVFYNRGNTVHVNSFIPTEHTEYEVLKMNKTSVKTKVMMGHIEYTFKFAGVAGNYKPGFDALITITS